MTCCLQCEYESISEPGVTKCLDSNCPCHSKDDGLERVLERFDKEFVFELSPKGVKAVQCLAEELIPFITQVYKEAYTAGKARMRPVIEDSACQRLIDEAKESERERIRKELPEVGEWSEELMESVIDTQSYLEGRQDYSDQVKKII